MASSDAAATAAAAAKPKLTLYWLNQSRAQRIVWLLEELGMDYDIEIFQREGKFAPASAKEIHPLGKFPMLKVDDKILPESGFITEYLVDKYGDWLKPKDEDSLMRYKYFLHYAEGSIMQPLTVGYIMLSIKSAPVPFFLKPILNMVTSGVESSYLKPNYKTHFDFLDAELSSRPWIAGEEFSGADILVTFPVEAAKKRGLFTKESHPTLWEYTEKCAQRDAYKRAANKTEKFEGPRAW